MEQDNLTIVVITPVKNEAWILNRFLSVTSSFADIIFVADQGSTDESAKICARYPKVKLVRNEGSSYSEAERQLLLLKVARENTPRPRLILALDADEMIAADAPGRPGWNKMLKAKPGTIIRMEKITVLPRKDRCIRYYPFALGYMDDDAEHTPLSIHSERVPMPDHASELILDDVKVLHYLLVRPGAQASKNRFYSAVENVLGNKNLLRRRLRYDPGRDYLNEGRIETVDPEWFRAWEEAGIDMKSTTAEKYYWYDVEVLKFFTKYGSKRFWAENIWDIGWEELRKNAMLSGVPDVPMEPISGPPRILTAFMRASTAGFAWLLPISRRLRTFGKRLAQLGSFQRPLAQKN